MHYKVKGHFSPRFEVSNIASKVFFAGEATSLNEYGFAHAALYTGLREAERLKTLLPQ